MDTFAEQRISGSDGMSLVRVNEVDLHEPLRSEAEPIDPLLGAELMLDLGPKAEEYLTIQLDEDGVRKLRLALQRLERRWRR